MQVLVPLGGLVAVHAVQEGQQQGIVTQHLLDLGGTPERLFQRPLRRDAGMHHGGLALGVMVDEFLLAQPVDQVGAIGRIENGLERIGAFQALDIVRHGQQVQIMVAQHRDGRAAQVAHETQRLERLRAAVHHIAGQPQAITGRAEIDPLQQATKGFQATLQVADSVGGQCSAPGTARRKGAMIASKL